MLLLFNSKTVDIVKRKYNRTWNGKTSFSKLFFSLFHWGYVLNNLMRTVTVITLVSKIH